MEEGLYKKVLANYHQIENHVLYYCADKILVVELRTGKEQELDLVVEGIEPNLYNLLDQSPTYLSFFELVVADGHLYSLVCDKLYEMDLTNAVYKHQILNVNRGFARMIEYQNKLLLTDEKAFYIYDPQDNTVKPKTFYYKSQPITSQDVVLYSFGGVAVTRVQMSNDMSVYVLKDDECQLLDSVRELRPVAARTGLLCLDAGDMWHVVDLTRDEIYVQYSRPFRLPYAECEMDATTGQPELSRAFVAWLGLDEGGGFWDRFYAKRRSQLERCGVERLRREPGMLLGRQKLHSEEAVCSRVFLESACILPGKTVRYRHLETEIASPDGKVVLLPSKIPFQDHQTMEKIPSAVFQGKLYAIFGHGLMQLGLTKAQKTAHIDDATGHVDIAVSRGTMFVVADSSLFQFNPDTKALERIPGLREALSITAIKLIAAAEKCYLITTNYLVDVHTKAACYFFFNPNIKLGWSSGALVQLSATAKYLLVDATSDTLVKESTIMPNINIVHHGDLTYAKELTANPAIVEQIPIEYVATSHQAITAAAE